LDSWRGPHPAGTTKSLRYEEAASIQAFQKASIPNILTVPMAATPRPWYRSPALWFLLPGLVFLVWAWVFSMQRVTNLDFEFGGYSVRLQNEGSTASATWRETPRRHITFAKTFAFEVVPRWPHASTNWFPLPSYVVNRLYSPAWHNLEIPHWFLLLVYVGLWQLPWLARYHRRRRIERALALVPAAPVTGAETDLD
jgi:hypothetical protein